MMRRDLLNSFQRHRRPYWLLFALALFLAGQCLSLEHAHNLQQAPDTDCALCLFSSANAGALATDVWSPLAVAVFTPIFFLCVVAVSRINRRFYDSQAPPFNS